MSLLFGNVTYNELKAYGMYEKQFLISFANKLTGLTIITSMIVTSSL